MSRLSANATPLMRHDSDFLSRRPRRCLAWEEDEEGRAVLLRPKFGRGRLGRWLGRLLGHPHYRIRLDEVGTLVWKACDGKTRLEEVLERMRRRFGPAVEPAEERLYRFVSRMFRSRLIEL